MKANMNMMNSEIPYDLIAKCLSGQCNEKEMAELEFWKNENSVNDMEFNLMQKAWQESSFEHYKIDTEAALKHVGDKITESPKRNFFRQNKWLRIAAILIVTLGSISIFYYLQRGDHKNMLIAENKTIKPLTINLPDGSIVYLNKNSVLKYPRKFSKTSRKVILEGEAYFEIEHDTNRPFTIESGKAFTQVLGTKFNLRAYNSDTSLTLTVAEGLVSFGILSKTLKIKAGETGKVNTLVGSVRRYQNTDPNFLAWKTGILMFERSRLDDAITAMSSYYNKQIQIENPKLDSIKFTCTIDNLPFDEALTTIEILLGDVKIVKENGIYYLR